jgi:iron complex outermembrane recepter protein
MNKKRIAKISFAALLGYSMQLNAQFSLSGQVKSDKGEPIPFATVSLKNTQLAVIADTEGKFSFGNLKDAFYVVNIKAPGFEEKADTVAMNGNQDYSPVLVQSAKQLDEVAVNATRVDNSSGMAFSNVSAETIKKQNLGQDAPYMLNQLPNVVVNSDAGNGVGYTGLRIRGSDATRINVTINGVPVNDAESQGTFWVDMPDLVSSVNNIQVQRGVGASSNGAGAFGATINFQTNTLNEKPYANLISTAGSFDTYRNTLAAGTGLLNNKFTLDARASRITSRGYIDRASSDLDSYYMAAGYYGKKSVVKFIGFSGKERTYQAWYYIPEDSIKKGNRTYNPAGEYYDQDGKVHYYKNETDNYKQDNYQLHFIHQFNSRLNFNMTGHYTKGKGYYEQYKQGASLADYNLSSVITPKGDTITHSDLIRRLWLDNDFAGGVFNFNYVPSQKLSFVLGGGYNTYFGKHFGRVMWARYASDSEIDQQYYLDAANKNDMNVYLKTNFKPVSDMNIFIDLQTRNVNYRFFGFNDSLQQQMQDVSYSFFNPKMGLSYNVNKNINVFASAAMANKEPNRDDFVQSSPKSRPKSEQLLDIEAGLKYVAKKFNFAANLYNMQYKNQLVLNGEVNNVGAYNRVNVASSFRRGMELEANAALGKYFNIGGNVALSQNKITRFVEYVDNYDDNTQNRKEYNNADISFSPNQVASIIFTAKLVKNLEVSFIDKYVGRQFLDNTGNVKRSINPYNVLDARVNYTIKTKVIPEIGLMLSVYNILNEQYTTNGYTFSYYSGGQLSTYNYLAPAAPLNFLGGINLKF